MAVAPNFGAAALFIIVDSLNNGMYLNFKAFIQCVSCSDHSVGIASSQ